MIPLIRNIFRDERGTRRRLANWLNEGHRLTMGDQCREFERVFAAWHGEPNAVLFNSGASANLAIIQTLLNTGMLREGDRVAVSGLTWATNVMPLIQLGLQPVPVDIKLNTLNMSIKRVKAVDVQCIFVTHALGLCTDMIELEQHCINNDIILIEDNCESLGTSVKTGQSSGLLGTWGAMSSCSFYAAHHMSTIEGGMVLTDVPEYAQMLKMVRANGWDRALDNEQKKIMRAEHGVDDFSAAYTFYFPGYNLRPTEITGFLGCDQIKSLRDTVKKREDNFLDFMFAYEQNDDFIHFDFSHIDIISSFCLPVVCKTKELRDKYLVRFNEIAETRPIIGGNITRQPFYERYTTRIPTLSSTEHISECGFYIGNHPDLTVSEMNMIKGLLK